MGYGDSQLTPDDLLVAAEAETRRLLARYGEPSVVDPPADLADRVISALSSPAPQPVSRLRRVYGGLIALCLIALVAFGSWGVLFDSSGPARLFGDMGGGMGQLLLFLILAAKPLINILLTAGAATLAVLAAILGGSWLWLQILRREMATSLEARA